MEPIRHVKRFTAIFPNGTTLDIPIYTSYHIRNEARVYHYLCTTPNARGIIYKCTNERRWLGREDIHITHPKLNNPIILDYTMGDAAVCTYLVQRLRNYLQSQPTRAC